MGLFSKKKLLACVCRELEKRRQFYPRWVAERKMKQRDADDQIAMMEEIYRLVMNAPDSEFPS